MASASEMWDSYKKTDIDDRFERARKMMENSGNEHMTSVIGKIQAGREVRKGYKEVKRKGAARKGMKMAKAKRDATGPKMKFKKGR